MIDFTKYQKSKTWAIYTQIPIIYLDEFRRINRMLGKYYRIRYRGPRNTPLDKGRGYQTRQASCLKKNATSFSVYRY